MIRPLHLLLLAVYVYGAGRELQVGADEDEMRFEAQIRPILVNSCYECHGPKKQESGLRLDSKLSALVGGDRGPALVPGDSDASPIATSIRRGHDLKMPPDRSLKSVEIDAIVAWIDRGAAWPNDDRQTGTEIRSGGITPQDRRFWSFGPLSTAPAPDVRDSSWAWTSIDRHILARLEKEGIAPNPDADKETLIRRVTLDFTGLLPTPDEIDAFLADESNEAAHRVVARLLASNVYGERWGRHWLDIVRHADTSGLTSDHPVPQARRY